MQDTTSRRGHSPMKNLQPAKALLVAAVIGLGLSGGFAAATFLGIPRTDIETKLRADQTLAQIANATSGKSRDGLLNALVADATAKIDAAQKAGTITADRATQLKSDLSTRMAQLVDSTRPFTLRRGVHR